METIPKIGWEDIGSWRAILASLLPLWLLSIAITAEGFPRPPMLLELLAIAAFYLVIPVSIILLWKTWLTFDLFLYSFFPLIFVFIFDEIATNYKTPFILASALILTIGVAGYQRSIEKNSITSAWLILLITAIAACMVALHAAQNYWQMFDGFEFPFGCFPGTLDCPLPANLSPWWMLFFSW